MFAWTAAHWTIAILFALLLLVCVLAWELYRGRRPEKGEIFGIAMIAATFGTAIGLTIANIALN